MGTVDVIGDRMKAYENVNRTYLTRRLPMILRLDGCHFHSYTKEFNKPFDRIFSEAMWETARKLCENIEGAKLAYVQSDEISILLTDYDTLTTEPWFGKNIQKMVSISASMASIFFDRAHQLSLKDFIYDLTENNMEIPEYVDAHYRAQDKLAVFDCRAFVLPIAEVNNYFYWRQLDCQRNSVNSLAHSLFSDKELLSKSTEERKEMIWKQKNIQWDLIPSFYKNGICARKYDRIAEALRADGVVIHVPRKKWEIDTNIPIFSKKPEYINELVNC